MNERVRHILGLVLEMPEQDIHESLSAEGTSNWDSIRHLNLVYALEDAFGVSFPADQWPLLTSYRAIADALAERGIS